MTDRLATVQKQIQESPLSLLYLSQPDCSVCVAVKAQLPKQMAETNVPIFYLDAREDPAVASAFNVLTAPTVILFAQGKELLRQNRFIDFAAFKKMIAAVKEQKAISYDELFQ